MCVCVCVYVYDIFFARCSSKATSIVKDPTHPSHSLFQLLPSGRRYQSIRAHSVRLLNSFFPQAVRALNSNHLTPLWNLIHNPSSWNQDPGWKSKISISKYYNIYIWVSINDNPYSINSGYLLFFETTIMGKTADLAMIQKTNIDTLHKEGKSQKVITERCGCLQSAVSKHIKCKVDWKEEFG